MRAANAHGQRLQFRLPEAAGTIRMEGRSLVEALAGAATVHETPCGDGAMRWREWGRGETLVLLHGGFGSWLHWVRNIEALSARESSPWQKREQQQR